MRNLKSLFLTLLCAAIILGAAYLGIVELGRQILRREGVPERAEYENAGSKIFYGKIEDDIEIFPWNYYPENGVKDENGIAPYFMTEDLFIGQYFPERLYDIKDSEMGLWTEEKAALQESGLPGVRQEDSSDPLMQLFLAADAYFSEMIAYEAHVSQEEAFGWLKEDGRHILQNMVMADNLSVGTIYFYQETMELSGKQYQVRIACGEWNVINFVCTEYGKEDRREQEAWKEGKQKMVEMLEQSEEALSKYVYYMFGLKDMGAPAIYYFNEEYRDAYILGFRWLEGIVQGKGEDEKLSEEMSIRTETWQEMYQSDLYDDVNYEEVQEDQKTDSAASYSYQVVELKDVILLLIQGDGVMGIYYDPMNCRFCGYNFFYEY